MSLRGPFQLLCDLEISGAGNDLDMAFEAVEGCRDQHGPAIRARREASRNTDKLSRRGCQ